MCDISAQYTRELLLKNTTISHIIEFPKVAPHKEGQLFKDLKFNIEVQKWRWRFCRSTGSRIAGVERKNLTPNNPNW